MSAHRKEWPEPLVRSCCCALPCGAGDLSRSGQLNAAAAGLKAGAARDPPSDALRRSGCRGRSSGW